jgi:hypothetical protein
MTLWIRRLPITGNKTLMVPLRRQENGPSSMLTSESMAEKDLTNSEKIIEKGRLQKESTSIGEGWFTAKNSSLVVDDT